MIVLYSDTPTQSHVSSLNAHAIAEVLKLWSSQWFGKGVCYLILSTNIVDLCLLLFHMVAYDVIFEINVFESSVVSRVGGREDSSWLSEQRGIGCSGGYPISVCTCLNQTSSEHASESETYSDSVELRAGVLFIRDVQHTAPSAMRKTYPVVDRRLSRSSAQSASQKPLSPEFPFLLYQIFMLVVPRR